jgi:hypothetical protein
MKIFLYPSFALAMLTVLLLSSCNTNPLEKRQKAQEASLAADESLMIERFKSQVESLQTLAPNKSEFNVKEISRQAQALFAQYGMISTEIKTEKDNLNTDSTAQVMPEIKNSAILMGVRDYQETQNTLKDLIADYQGSLESEHENSTVFRNENTYVIRIAPDKFVEFGDKVSAMAAVTQQKKIWKQDLSTEFIELSSRFKSKNEAKTRLEQMMKTAKTPADILPIQRELDEVIEELDALSSKTLALADQKAYCTVVVAFYQEKTIAIAGTETASLGDNLSLSALDGMGAFKDMLIIAAYHWPYIAAGFLFMIPIVMAVYKNRRRARRFKLQAMQNKPWAIHDSETQSLHEKQFAE